MLGSALVTDREKIDFSRDRDDLNPLRGVSGSSAIWLIVKHEMKPSRFLGKNGKSQQKGTSGTSGSKNEKASPGIICYRSSRICAIRKTGSHLWESVTIPHRLWGWPINSRDFSQCLALFEKMGFCWIAGRYIFVWGDCMWTFPDLVAIPVEFRAPAADHVVGIPVSREWNLTPKRYRLWWPHNCDPNWRMSSHCAKQSHNLLQSFVGSDERHGRNPIMMTGEIRQVLGARRHNPRIAIATCIAACRDLDDIAAQTEFETCRRQCAERGTIEEHDLELLRHPHDRSHWLLSINEKGGRTWLWSGWRHRHVISHVLCARVESVSSPGTY